MDLAPLELRFTVACPPAHAFYERTPDGAEHDWGEVLAWEPPRRLVSTWHLRFEPTSRRRAPLPCEPCRRASR
jgi:uncharacterized protein YndB with AHSA1/START domain